MLHTTPVAVSQMNVDLSVQMFVNRVDHTRQQHQERDDEATGDEDVAQEKMQYEPSLNLAE